jgi:hypothetical protein
MGLELPGGMRIEAPDPTAAALAPVLGAINHNLLALIRLVDLLVKLECGAVKREDLRRSIQEREFAAARAAKAASNGEVEG